MRKQFKTGLKRGVAFVLTAALLWTDASTAAFATSATPEPFETAASASPAKEEETSPGEEMGTPTPAGESGAEGQETPTPTAETPTGSPETEGQEPQETGSPEAGGENPQETESPEGEMSPSPTAGEMEPSSSPTISPTPSPSATPENLNEGKGLLLSDANGALGAPENVKIGQSESQISLSFIYSDPQKVAKYSIYRSEKENAGESDWTLLKEINSPGKNTEQNILFESEVDLETGNNKVYYFKVIAEDADGNKAESAVVTNKGVPTGLNLEKTEYQGICFLDETGSKIDNLSLFVGEGKKISAALIDAGGQMVTAESLRNEENEDQSDSASVKWTIIRANDSGELEAETTGSYMKDVLTPDVLPYMDSMWFEGTGATGGMHLYIEMRVLMADMVEFQLRMPVTVTADGSGHQGAPAVTICGTKEEAYQTVRDMLVQRDQDWFLVENGVFDQFSESGRLSLQEAFDFYQEREGMKPYEGDYLNFTVGDPNAVSFLYTDYDYHSIRYHGVYYNAYKTGVPFMTSREQEDAVDSTIDALLNQEGGALYPYRNQSDQAKVKAIYNYIVDHVSYKGTTTPVYHTAYSALINGEGTCQAYALLFTRLSREMGLPSKVIMGTDANAHTYNIVKVDEKWYYIDTSAKIYLSGANKFPKGQVQSCFQESRYVQNYLNLVEGADYVPPKTVTVTDDQGTVPKAFYSVEEAAQYVKDEAEKNTSAQYLLTLDADMTAGGGDLNFRNANPGSGRVRMDLNGHTLTIDMEAGIFLSQIYDSTGQSKGIAANSGQALHIEGNTEFQVDLKVSGDLIIDSGSEIRVHNLTVNGTTELYTGRYVLISGVASFKNLKLKSYDSTEYPAFITLLKSENGAQNGQMKFSGKLTNETNLENPLLIEKRICTEDGENAAEFDSGEIIATVTSQKKDFPEAYIAITGNQGFVEREGNYLKAAKNVVRVSRYDSETGIDNGRYYSSMEKAVAGLTADFGGIKGEYSFAFEDNCILSRDVTIPAFVTTALMQTPRWENGKIAYCSLDLNGHSITFASNSVLFFEGMRVINSSGAASKLTLTGKESSLFYQTRGGADYVDASRNEVTLPENRPVFSNVNINAVNAVYLQMDSGYVQEGMEEYTYEISGEISANRVNISGNTWKINKISASYLELQGSAYSYSAQTSYRVNTALECDNVAASNGLVTVGEGTELTIAKELTLNNVNTYIMNSDNRAGKLTAGTINVKKPYATGPSVANYGIWKTDRLIAPSGSIFNSGAAYIKNTESVKDLYLKENSIWVCDTINQVSGGVARLSASSELVINDKAALQTLEIRAAYDDNGASMGEEAFLYVGSTSTVSLLHITKQEENLALKYGKIASDTSVVIDEDGDLGNGTAKLNRDENGCYPVLDLGARSFLFTTGNKAFPVEELSIMQSDPASKYTRAYQLGQNVYVGGEWITIKAQDADGDDSKARTLKSFIKWTDASAYLAALSNSSMTYIVEISEDVDTQEALTLPAKAEKVIFRGTKEGGRIEFRFVGDIKLPTNVTFENIDLEAEKYEKSSNTYVKDVKAASLGGKALELLNSSAEFTTVSGAAGSRLFVLGAGKSENELTVAKDLTVEAVYFNNTVVKVGGKLTITNAAWTASVVEVAGAVNVKNTLTMGNAALDGNGKITLNNLISHDDKNKICYADNQKNILTITGNISADSGYSGDTQIDSDGMVVNENGIARIRKAAIDISVKSLEGNYSQNVLLLNAEKAASGWFVVGSAYAENGERNQITHLTHKDGKAIKCNSVAKQAVVLESYDQEAGAWIYNGGFETLQEAFSEIDRLAEVQKKYMVTIIDDQGQTAVTTTSKALTLPTKAAEVTVAGRIGQAGKKAVLSYKGGLTLKCNVILENLIFNPGAAKAQITLGNYSLKLKDCEVAAGKSIGKVSGSGVTKDSQFIFESPELKMLEGELSNIAVLSLVGSDLHVKGKIAVGKLQMGSNNTLEAEDAVTITNIQNEDGNGTLLAPAAVTRNKAGEITKIVPKITITGTIMSAGGFEIGLTEKTSAGFSSIAFEEMTESELIKGIRLAKAQNVTTDVLEIYPNNAGSMSGMIAKKGGYLVFYPEAQYGARLVYKAENEEVVTYCLNLADALEEISSLKTKRDYTIYLTETATNEEAPTAIKMPGKNLAQTLTIAPEGDNPAMLYYTGGISFTSDIVLKDISFVQMLKGKNGFEDAAGEQYPYPKAVKVSAGGYAVTIEGTVSFNTPLELDGGSKGALRIADKAVLTTTYDGTDNELYGNISKFAEVQIGVSEFVVAKYETKQNAFAGGDLQAAKLSVENCTLTAQNNVTVQAAAVSSGELFANGKANLGDVILSGDHAVIMADLEFNITGNLTSTTDDAHLHTRRKLDKKAQNCIPYLNVKGNVFLEDQEADRIYIGVYPNLADPDNDATKPVKLTDAPAATSQLLTAQKADAGSFRAEAENVNVNEYSAVDTDGYILRKDKDKVLVYYADEVAVALCAGDTKDGKLETAQVMGYYTSFNEAVAAINGIKDVKAEYTILLLQNVGSAAAPVSLELPKEAARVYIRSASLSGTEDEIRSIYYKNNLTLKASVDFCEIDLAPVKVAKSGAQGAQLSVSVGAYELGLVNVSVGKAADVDQETSKMAIKDISGNGNLMLDTADILISGNVKVRDVAVLQKAVIAGSFSAAQVGLMGTNLTVQGAVTITDITNLNGTITYNKNANHITNLTINGKIINHNEPLKLCIQLADNETRQQQELVQNGVKIGLDKTKNLANIGLSPLSDITMEMVKNGVAEQGVNENLVKAEKAVYLVNSSTDDNTVRLGSQGSSGSTIFLDLTQAVKEINALNNKKGQYRISVVEAGIGDVDVTDTKAVSGIKLPDAGKAQSVTIEGGAEGNAAKQLAVQGAVSYKGTLELEHVSVNADSVAVNTLKLTDTKLSTKKASTVTNLVLAGASGWDMLGAGTITSIDATGAKLDGEEEALSYLASKQDKNGKPLLTVKGKVSGERVLCKLITAETTAADHIVYFSEYKDQNLVIAPAEAAEKFVAFPFRMLAAKAAGAEEVEGITAESWNAYKDRNNYVKNGNLAEMTVEITGTDGSKTYAKTFEEAVTIIDNMNDLQAEYTMTLLDTGDYIVKTGKDGTYGAMKLPAKAKTVTIKGESESCPTIMFTGEVKPNCDLVFENLRLTDGKLNKGVFTRSYSIALNMGNYNVTFAQGAATGANISISCTKISGKKALTLEGQSLKGKNANVELGELRLKNGASLRTDKGIKITNVYVEDGASVSLNSPAAIKLTNITGTGELLIHSYYTKKELSKAVSQLTIDGNIEQADVNQPLTVKMIPYICRDVNAGTYTAATAQDITALTLTGNKPAAFQKLINLPKAATENIEIEYELSNGDLSKTAGTLYKYEKGLYLTSLEAAVEVCGRHTGETFNTYQTKFCTLEDAVKEINSRNDLNMDYNIMLLKNIGMTNKAMTPISNLKLPTKAKSVTIQPARGEASGNTIVFTGNLTIGCATTFDGICMAAVKQYKSGNYQYYGATSYNINVGGNELREYNVLQEATVSSMNGYYASNLVRSVGTLSGNAKGSYYCSNVAPGSADDFNVAGKIAGVGTVVFMNGGNQYKSYVVSGGITGVNEIIVYAKATVEAYNGNVTANNILILGEGLINTKNLTCSKVLTLQGGAIFAGSKAVGDGKISLNHVVLQERNNYLQGKQDKNGKSLIEIKGTVTTENDWDAAAKPKQDAITIGLKYNNGSTYAQLHEGMVLLTAPKVSTHWFTPAYSGEEEGEEAMGAYNNSFGVLKSGKKIIYGCNTQDKAEVSLIINPGPEEEISQFKNFEEAVKEIDALSLKKEGSKEYVDYVIELQSDVEIGNQKKDGKYSSLALPSKAGTLIIIGNGHKLRFAGNISLKSNLVLQNMELCPVKTVKNEVVPTKANWTLGKFELALDKVYSADEEGNTLVGTISGSASSALLNLIGTDAAEESPYVLAADQISGLRTIVLNPYTRLEVNKNLTTYELVFETQREGEADAGVATVRVGGKLTTTLVHKNGIGDAVILKPVTGEIVVNGAEMDLDNDKIKEKYSVCFADGLTEEQQKLIIELEGENLPAGTKIATCKFIDKEHYKILATDDASQNERGTYVNGTVLLLG